MEEKNKYVGRKAFITGINGQDGSYILPSIYT
jgi:GDP-D-mannose dehydratase